MVELSILSSLFVRSILTQNLPCDLEGYIPQSTYERSKYIHHSLWIKCDGFCKQTSENCLVAPTGDQQVLSWHCGVFDVTLVFGKWRVNAVTSH